MANETTFALIEGDLAYDYALLAEEIIGARYAYDNVRDLARTKDIGSFPSDSARFPLYPALTAGALTDGTDLTTNTAFSPTTATFAVSEVGLKLLLTDLARSGSYLGDSDLATEAGKAVLEKINTDLCALASGFSTVVGSTGVNLTEANIESAIITLIGNKTPDDVVGVLHQQQWFDLINDIGTSISPAGTTGGTARGETNDLTIAGKGGMGGVLYGVEFRVNPLIATANAGADRAGALFIRNRAIALVLKWFIRPEFERDASYRGTETVVTAAYAVGEIEDASGVSVITDA
jgi:hypothetical protein